MTRCTLISLVLSAVMVCGGLLCRTPQSLAQPVVLESAELGATGRSGGTSIATSQFIGWRFETNQPLAVERVGGHLLSFPDEPGDIFAALVRLASIDSVPLGAPFTPEEVIATTTFHASFPSDEVLVPLSAILKPGSYTLVFGTGMFGATGAGAAHNGDDQPDIPPTNLSSFIFWSIPFFGQPFEWRRNLASHMRFVIEAQTITAGDYNRNGVVDGADYVVWRHGLGGAFTPGDYDVWRAHFGDVASGGSNGTANATIPEPATLTIILAAILAACARRC